MQQKPKTPKRWMLPVIYSIITAPLSWWVLTFTSKALTDLVFYGVLAGFYGVMIILLYEEQKWRKTAIFIIFNINILFAAGMTFIGARIWNFDTTASGSQIDGFAVIALFAVCYLFCIAITAYLWIQHIYKRQMTQKFWIFLLFPLSQLFLTDCIKGRPIEGADTVLGIITCSGILCGFLADYILLYILDGQARADEMKKKLQEMEKMQELSSLHEQEMEKRREEMSAVRQKYNQQLTEIYQLLEKNKKQDARQLLDTLKTQIANTKENIYCRNKIVNAVLSEKKQICDSHGIILETEMEIGEEIGIESLHLCSLFSNLIDNAIHAASDCEAGNRKISLHSGCKGEYLIVRIVNSSKEPPKKEERKRRGYGMEIIDDISRMYQGEYSHDYKEGQYCATVSLLQNKENSREK